MPPKPTKGAKAAKPAAKAAKPAKAAKAAKPAAKQAKAAKPAAKAAKPSKAAKVAKVNKVAKSGKAAKVAKPGKAAKVAKVSKSAKVAKIVKKAKVAKGAAKSSKVAKAGKTAKVAKVAKKVQKKPAKVAKPAKKVAQPVKKSKKAKKHVPKKVRTKEENKALKKIQKKKRNSNPLFEKRPKVFAIGRDINVNRDLTRYVLWPKYIRLQRQKKILYSRLRVPPAINQFSKTLDKNTAIQLFQFCLKYRPEDKAAKKHRLVGEAIASQERRMAAKKTFRLNKNKKNSNLTKKQIKDLKKAAKETAKAKTVAHKFKRKNVVKCGVNHVTNLVESKRAKLVLIANDVDPIELVVWLPTLCKKMNVPYCIVKNKARLGKIVGKKTATCLAFTSVNSKHQNIFDKLVYAIDLRFNKKYEEFRRSWGGNKVGMKARHAVEKKRVAMEKEKAKAARK